MELLGRKDEVKSLEWDLSKDEPQFVAVYGRRRVGKTYLVRELFHDQFVFSHTGLKGANMRGQLTAFRASLVRYGLVDCPVLHTWLEAFDALDRLIAASPTGRKVVFIDELPWMDTPRSGLVTGLENFWNGRATARPEKDVFLIVCGSASSWIVTKLLKNCEGLYGRLTDRIWVRPFTLRECEIYAERLGLSMTRAEICEAYMVFGGIPYYWSLLRPDFSLAQNIDALCFAPQGKLRDEFQYLYASIFRNATPHLKVVKALSARKSGMTREEIVAATGLVNGGNFKVVLEELEQCDFIRRYAPAGCRNRGARFQLMDNFTLFHQAFLADGKNLDERYWSSSLASPKVRTWKALAFERVCLQHVRQLKQALGIAGIRTDAYAWRAKAEGELSRGAQVDLVLDRADRTVDLCEMKYSEEPYEIDKDEYERLCNRRLAYSRELGGGKNCRTVLVTSAGVRPGKYRGVAQAEVTLEELFV